MTFCLGRGKLFGSPMHKWYPRKTRNRFYNSSPNYTPESFLFGTMPSMLQSVIARFTRTPYNSEKWFHTTPLPSQSSSLQISWIGHATFLIQINDYNIITDPVFGNLLSPLFPRLLKPGISATSLPPIDYVLISHNHRDHMDRHSLYTIKQKNPNVHILVAQGDKAWFDYHNFAHSSEHSWWEEITISPQLRFTFLPSVHWSQRYLFDKNRSLWGSWMISCGNQHVYFAGDTAYGDHFAQIAHEFPTITAALLPIGPGEPSQWMQHNHLNSETALQAFETLRAHAFIPMHWGTFAFGSDHGEEPIIRLKQAWEQKKETLNDRTLHIIKAGEPVHVHQKEQLPAEPTHIPERDEQNKQEKQHKENS